MLSVYFPCIVFTCLCILHGAPERISRNNHTLHCKRTPLLKHLSVFFVFLWKPLYWAHSVSHEKQAHTLRQGMSFCIFKNVRLGGWWYSSWHSHLILTSWDWSVAFSPRLPSRDISLSPLQANREIRNEINRSKCLIFCQDTVHIFGSSSIQLDYSSPTDVFKRRRQGCDITSHRAQPTIIP